MGAEKARVRLDPAQKERIVFLANQGFSYQDIARDIGCKVPQVVGYVRTMVNFGKIPKELAQKPMMGVAHKRREKTRVNQARLGLPLSPSIPLPEHMRGQELPTADVEITQDMAPAAAQAVQDHESGLGQAFGVGQETGETPAISVGVIGGPSAPLEQPQEPLAEEAPQAEAQPAFEPEAAKASPQSAEQAPLTQVEQAAPPQLPPPVPPAPVPSVAKEIKTVPVPLPPPIMEIPMNQAPIPASAPQSPVRPAGWEAGRPAQGYSFGFTNPNQTVRFQVERKIPADGIVGYHTGQFTEEDLCHLYGEGHYRVLMFTPGRPIPTEHEVKVGPAFGAPRSPKRSSEEHSREPRRYGMRGSDEEGAPPPRYERPQYGERSLFEYARHAPAAAAGASSDVTAEAIRQLGEANKRAQEQVESARKGGPDTFITSFFQNQTDLLRKQMDDEKKLQEQRRREDDEKWERRQREVQNEYQRRQDEEEKRHQRDLERLRLETQAKAEAAKIERQMLMDLEDKKLALIREEAKLRQDILQQELQANREAMKELQDQTAVQVEAVKTAMQRELERDRQALEREHKIREKGLDKEHELSSKILDIKQESLQKQGGDQIYNLLETVVKQASEGLKQVVDLQKLQSMTPEAQAAAVAGRGLGNAHTAPAQADSTGVQQGAPQPAAPSGSPEAQPEVEVQEEAGGSSHMDAMIQKMVEEPAFRQVISEWGRQVKFGEDPTAFASMFTDWQNDPSDFQLRKGCSMFVNYIKTRTWPEVLAVIGPKVDRDVLAVFKTKHADDFYEGFRAIVVEQTKAYFEAFMNERQKKGAAEPAAQAPAPEGPEAAAPEAQGAEDDGVPVPARGSLRPVK